MPAYSTLLGMAQHHQEECKSNRKNDNVSESAHRSLSLLLHVFHDTMSVDLVRRMYLLLLMSRLDVCPLVGVHCYLRLPRSDIVCAGE